MRYLFILLLIFTTTVLRAQTVTATQQKALNAYVDYANQSAEEVSAVVKSFFEYYPSLHRKTSWPQPRYVCPVQLEEYYLNNARALSKNLSPTIAASLNEKLEALRKASQAIDAGCKDLDTYHKLEDYKKDNYAHAELVVNQIQGSVVAYKKVQAELIAALEASVKKMNTAPPGSYGKATTAMYQQLIRERNFLDQWNFNLKADVHTGWPVDKLEQSISETDAAMSTLKAMAPTLKYPASSMWPSFQEALGSLLDVKRRGLDQYNFEAKKSDEHSNKVYMDLINYFNGVLIADFNAFEGFSERDGYYGLKAIKYFPIFEIRTEPKVVNVSVKTFDDLPRTPLALPAQKTAIPKNAFIALTTYVEYIDETWRQVRNMQTLMNNFNGDAAYYRNIDDFSRHGAMRFEFKDYQLPLSHLQQSLSLSKNLPPAVAKPLNDQAQVLMNILKELNDQAAVLEVETKEKRYEKDRLDRVYKIIERQHELLSIWDERKELFYADLRKVFESYPPTTPTSSWYLAGHALWNLTDLDHEAVFKAKEFYKGTGSATISTEKIDATLRDVIAKEYDNLKGIEKIGRNNGNCPYTPYEDLPITSRSLSEQLTKLKSPKEASSSIYDHPYHGIVYLYNDIVEDYNKFCELSTTVPHLKTIHQPEWWNVKYPGEKKVVENKVPPRVTTTTPTTTTEVPSSQPEPTKPVTTKSNDKPQAPTSQTKVLHDTVYIERRDTIYMGDPGEELRSMEGYATNNLILLLDVSGSMNTPEKLPILKKSVLDMLSMMRQEDKVSIIAFSAKPKVLIESISFKEESKIKKAIDNLKSAGKTDGNAGLKLAYKVGDGNYIRGGNNRIILATDGEFGLSDETLALIQDFAKNDIFLTIFNFGKGAGSSKNLEHLAALGNGNYSYISKENVDLKLIREAKAKKKK